MRLRCTPTPTSRAGPNAAIRRSNPPSASRSSGTGEPSPTRRAPSSPRPARSRGSSPPSRSSGSPCRCALRLSPMTSPSPPTPAMACLQAMAPSRPCWPSCESTPGKPTSMPTTTPATCRRSTAPAGSPPPFASAPCPPITRRGVRHPLPGRQGFVRQLAARLVRPHHPSVHRHRSAGDPARVRRHRVADRPSRRRGVHGMGRRPHRLPNRRCRHAPARRVGLDAQPGPYDHCVVPREGSPDRLATRRTPLPAPAFRRRTFPERWQLAVGRRDRPDAAPYFRIFNPWSQSRKFDASGDYIRRWVPELAGLDATTIHEPAAAAPLDLAAAGVVLGDTYPEPIVDHALPETEPWLRTRPRSASSKTTLAAVVRPYAVGP